MDIVSRLTGAGIPRDCAEETAAWFRMQGDLHAMELYISQAEARANKRKECPA